MGQATVATCIQCIATSVYRTCIECVCDMGERDDRYMVTYKLASYTPGARLDTVLPHDNLVLVTLLCCLFQFGGFFLLSQLGDCFLLSLSGI